MARESTARFFDYSPTRTDKSWTTMDESQAQLGWEPDDADIKHDLIPTPLFKRSRDPANQMNELTSQLSRPQSVQREYQWAASSCTPTPGSSHIMKSTTTTLSNSCAYDDSMADFRCRLAADIARAIGIIQRITNVQQQRQAKHSTRLASSWNVQAIDANLENKDRKDRIERLRRDNWQVNKNKHGWKGASYYEELRSKALSELLDN